MQTHIRAPGLLFIGAIFLLGGCGRTQPAVIPPAPLEVNGGSAPEVDTEHHARILLERSLVALGGKEAVLGLGGFELWMDSRFVRGNWAQARDWRDSTPNPVPTRQHYVVDLGRDRATYEFLSTSPGPIRFNFRSGYDRDGQWQVDLMRWRLGVDLLRAPAATSRANLAAVTRLIPQGVVRQALTSGDSLRAEPREMLGRAVNAVTYHERVSGQRVELALDRETSLPLAITVGSATLEFDDYADVQGFQLPHLRRTRVDGDIVQQQRVTRVDLQPSLVDARFAPPAGYTDPPAAGSPKATLIAGQVYRLDDMPGGYHAAFMVRQEGLVVFEAPHSAQFTEIALRLIAEIAPSKRVTHVMVTHHHSDHVAGLGPYVAAGATIVLGEGLEGAIRRQLPDSLRERARFEPIAERRTLGSGNARIRALPVPNAHADGNVAYYIPAVRVLFQGDLFQLPERGPVTPAFPTTGALVRVVTEEKLRVDHVVAVHGRTGRWADVLEAVRLARGGASEDAAPPPD